MRHRLTLVAVAVLLCATPTQSQAQAARNSRATLPNDVSIELLGKALIYSFTYQRMVTPALGLEAGVGALGGGSSTENTTFFFFPVSAKFYPIPKDGSIFLTGGAVLLTAAADTGPFDETAADFYGQAGLGFEFRSTGGFLIRGTAYGLFGGGGYFIWPGLSVGYAF